LTPYGNTSFGRNVRVTQVYHLKAYNKFLFGCSNILLQPNNTLKHEIQIDNLKKKQKMLSSQNNMVILVSEDSNRYAHLFLIEREYFGFNTLESVVVE
jgi:hypothetical protein